MIITTIRIITTSAAPPMINHKRLSVNILPFAESSVAAVGWMFSLSTGMVSWVFNKIAPLLSTFGLNPYLLVYLHRCQLLLHKRFHIFYLSFL